MALSPEFSDYIKDLFAEFADVRVRRMFGGAGIFHNDVMLGLVADDTIFLRTDPESAETFAAEGCRRFTYRAKTKTVDLPYWTLPERLIDDPHELAAWARRAYAIAAAAKAKAGRKTKRAPAR